MRTCAKNACRCTVRWGNKQCYEGKVIFLGKILKCFSRHYCVQLFAKYRNKKVCKLCVGSAYEIGRRASEYENDASEEEEVSTAGESEKEVIK